MDQDKSTSSTPTNGTKEQKPSPEDMLEAMINHRKAVQEYWKKEAQKYEDKWKGIDHE